MSRTKTFLKILGTGLATGIWWGFISGLTLIFIKHHVFWSLVLTIAVLLALSKRLQKHWRTRNWLPFFITFPVATFCGSFPASLLWITITGGSNDARLNLTDKLIFLFTFILTLILTSFYFLVTGFWHESRLGRAIEQTRRGARVITNLNVDL